MPGHMKPDFLTVEDVIHIHGEQITAFGGELGLRDLALLESAVGMPKQTFGSRYLHDSLFMMAAAYLFHISQDHPFVDGNKRTGYIAALVFLRVNGVVIDEASEALYEMTMGVAQGLVDKEAVAAQLEGEASVGARDPGDDLENTG